MAVFTLSELLVLLKRTEANGEENLEFAYAVSITVVSIPACICILVTVFTVKEILNPNLTIKPARSFLELLKETWHVLFFFALFLTELTGVLNAQECFSLPGVCHSCCFVCDSLDCHQFHAK